MGVIQGKGIQGMKIEDFLQMVEDDDMKLLDTLSAKATTTPVTRMRYAVLKQLRQCATCLTSMPRLRMAWR